MITTLSIVIRYPRQRKYRDIRVDSHLLTSSDPCLCFLNNHKLPQIITNNWRNTAVLSVASLDCPSPDQYMPSFGSQLWAMLITWRAIFNERHVDFFFHFLFSKISFLACSQGCQMPAFCRTQCVLVRNRWFANTYCKLFISHWRMVLSFSESYCLVYSPAFRKEIILYIKGYQTTVLCETHKHASARNGCFANIFPNRSLLVDACFEFCIKRLFSTPARMLRRKSRMMSVVRFY